MFVIKIMALRWHSSLLLVSINLSEPTCAEETGGKKRSKTEKTHQALIVKIRDHEMLASK